MIQSPEVQAEAVLIIMGCLSPEQVPQHLQRVCDGLQEDGHPLEGDHHVQQVKGQHSGAAQIRGAVCGGRVLSVQLGQFGPVAARLCGVLRRGDCALHAGKSQIMIVRVQRLCLSLCTCDRLSSVKSDAWQCIQKL